MSGERLTEMSGEFTGRAKTICDATPLQIQGTATHIGDRFWKEIIKQVFADDLKQKGWTEIAESWEYAKGDWRVQFDTSSWMIVATRSNPRVFDVHVPGDCESRWTVNLIEHLCRMEDERHRLREALEEIRDNGASDPAARSTAKEALKQCYHTWLVNLDFPEGQPGRVYCPICKQTEKQ